MTDFKKIYATQAEMYDQLVAREDVAGHLLPALEGIRPFSDQTVVEMGAGTGRLTCLLAPQAGHIFAFDESAAMLAVARRRLAAAGWGNWETAVADHRHLPLGDNTAGIALEGWAFGHFVGWQPDNWREAMSASLAEMRRVLKLGGTMILLETLGTGFAEPNPPEVLLPLYDWLETERNFTHFWLRTDYRFATLDEARELLTFFFGAPMAAQATPTNYQQFPECTGIWYKNV